MTHILRGYYAFVKYILAEDYEINEINNRAAVE